MDKETKDAVIEYLCLASKQLKQDEIERAFEEAKQLPPLLARLAEYEESKSKQTEVAKWRDAALKDARAGVDERDEAVAQAKNKLREARERETLLTHACWISCLICLVSGFLVSWALNNIRR